MRYPPNKRIAIGGKALRIFQTVRDLTGAIQSLANALVDGDDGPRAAVLGERLDSLELSRSLWEANMEALVLKATGKFQASRNAEERAKKMRDFDEDLFDDEPEDRVEAEIQRPGGFLPDAYVQASEEAGVHGVPVGMEADGKAFALRAKFGG